MFEKLKKWWVMSPEEAALSTDAVYTRVLPEQRRSTIMLFIVAVAFAYTVTGFAVAADMINAQSSTEFWRNLLIGYSVLAMIAFFSGYPAYRTGCNTSIFFRYVFGSSGGVVPNLIIVFLLLGFSGFQVATIGEVLFPVGTWQFVVVCLITGLMIIWATVKGIKGLERASNMAILFLIISIAVVLTLSFKEIGGISGFNSYINNRSVQNPPGNAYLINIVIGSWAIGTLCNGNFTRYSKNAFTMFGFCIIAFFLVQFALAVLGATSLITVNTYLFVTYALKISKIFYVFCVIAFLLALWTTVNGNIYLAQIPLAIHARGSIRAVGVVLGLLAGIMGAFGFAQYISPVLNLSATILPPFMGPMVVDYYLHKDMYYYNPEVMMEKMPKWNWVAFVAAASGYFASLLWKPLWAPVSIWSILLSTIIYVMLYYVLKAKGIKVGLEGAIMDDELKNAAFKPYDPSDFKKGSVAGADTIKS